MSYQIINPKNAFVQQGSLCNERGVPMQGMGTRVKEVFFENPLRKSNTGFTTVGAYCNMPLQKHENAEISGESRD